MSPMANERDVSVHDRGVDQAFLVYPVISRRSGGLSLGINLFPDRKCCNFDCPYCEVASFEGRGRFSTDALEAQLEAFFLRDYAAEWAPRPLRDLCISGNGEPTLSPHLREALELCAAARRRHGAIAGSSHIVLITNSTGFLDKEIAGRLAGFARREPLKIWAKLDSGGQEGFAAMSRSAFRIDDLAGAMADFARATPIVVQTMICDLDGLLPSEANALAYAARLNAMMEAGARMEAIHIYTVARMPLERAVRPLSDEAIARFARLVSGALRRPSPISGYGERGEGPIFRR